MIHLESPTVGCDPETGAPWAKRLDTQASARYLKVVHGLPVEKKTLENKRARGEGPQWQYFGQRPLTTPGELDRYAAEDALRDESPLRRKAQRRAERRWPAARSTATSKAAAPPCGRGGSCSASSKTESATAVK
jgi:hypothetical protein